MKTGDAVIVERSHGTTQGAIVGYMGDHIEVGFVQFNPKPFDDGHYGSRCGQFKLWPSREAWLHHEWVTSARRNLAASVNLLTFEQLVKVNTVMDLGAGEVPS